MKSKSDQSDNIEEKKYALSGIISTNICIKNANIFLIADKKSMFLITKP